MQHYCPILYWYETEFIPNFVKDKEERRLAKFFNVNFRYINDVLLLNNTHFNDCLHRIYPNELEIKDTNKNKSFISYLDNFLDIDSNGRLQIRIYNKRDDFNFPIVNFLLLINH